MIDAARALAANAEVMDDATAHLADLVVREIERLDALRAALEAFTEQPAPSVAGEDASASSGEPRVARDSGAPPFESAVGVRDALAVEPEAAVVSPPTAAPAKHAKESFVCGRCPATFKTRGWRDRHEAKHPPVPDVTPRGGERVRRVPPGTEAVSGSPFNGGQAVGQ